MNASDLVKGNLCLPRRAFLKLTTGTVAGLALTARPIVAGPFIPRDLADLVPADKKLRSDWVKSLFARGSRNLYRWPESRLIGMPVGGICAGQLYLGGDGRLWHWDIFNEHTATGDRHYANPPVPASPLQQGFALRLTRAGQSQVRSMDHTGWRQVEFTGEYPVGYVQYRDPDSPVAVNLEAFSPFIPLRTEDSALPATLLHFHIQNTTQDTVTAEFAGWLENAVCLRSRESLAGLNRNRVVWREDFRFLECSAEPMPQVQRADPRPDIVFEDFEKETYEGWEATGAAFGQGPVTQDQIPDYQGTLGVQGRRAANTHASAPGNDVNARDAATGTLTSRTFAIDRDFITFLIGGGGHKNRTCIQLLVRDQVVRAATGRNDNRLQPHQWDVRPWTGQTARLRIVDTETGGWGNIGIDDIVFSDRPRGIHTVLNEQPDFGTLGLALFSDTDAPGENRPSKPADVARAGLPESHGSADLFGGERGESPASVARPFHQKLVGSLTRSLVLAPGQSGTVTFAITWHFPNLRITGLGDVRGRWYGQRFSSALAVADHLAQHRDRLVSQTRLWHDTWYDSTLPYWFLDRTFLNASILATNTCYWLGNGRFYAWEGVGCCPGTCTHVWHYAHAPARLFPALERNLREAVDYGAGFDAATGRIRFRAEHNDHWAVDGQSGSILRTYREHQVSADDTFLRRVWPRAKQALEFLISKDTDQDGIVDGPQHNTLDADWYGPVAWLSSLYLAALRAGEEMARELGETGFAARCRAIFEKGRREIDTRLFNGEYYVQLADPNRPKTVGSYDGCEIDQVFGDSWARQVGLGRILDEAKVKTALGSLWRYNFAPDVGPYRKAYAPGRWYALAGEGGLLMCTWPKGEAQRVRESFDFYFNECMTGFEYQVAGHMIAEGMVLEGLAIARMIHDRYHATRRNPWNEVECGDHYARAMASYGVFLAACGYEYHGPKKHLGFAPRLSPENFQCAFTAAEGWGTFRQQTAGGIHKASVHVKFGSLRLRSLALKPAGELEQATPTVTLSGQSLKAGVTVEQGRALIRFEEDVILNESHILEVAWA
jgi:uncharacterized protein (DUF608 family)